jgi:hypothetical protein
MVLTLITEFVRGIPRDVNTRIRGGLCPLPTYQGEQVHKRRLKAEVGLPRELGLGMLLFADTRTP